MKLFAVLAFLVIFSGGAATEVVRPKIAVLLFDSALPRQFEGLKEGMADIVTACFTAHAAHAEILDRSQLEGISAEATVNFDVKKIQLKSATHLLRGSLAPHDDGFAVTLMLYDLAAAQLVASADASGSTEEVAKTACNAVDALVGKFGALEAGHSGTAAPVTEENGRLMLEGMGYYYNGAFERALPAFLKLLKAEPENAAALYWLGKSYSGAGMKEEARIEFEKFAAKFPADARHAEVEGYLKGESK